MKKVMKTMLLIAIAISIVSCDSETIIKSGEIPVEINNYVTNHFSDDAIAQCIADREWFKKTFDVTLKSGTTLEFNSKKKVVSIDGNSQLPKSVIPKEVSKYVAANYPKNFITEWELEDKHQKAELDNGLELVFSEAGDFIRIDD